MKTSFFFVLWIIIYPILGLLNSSIIDNNAFLVSLAIVWTLSWAINRLMPNTIGYAQFLEVAPILENVFTGNVASFKKRLSAQTLVEAITAIYFIVTTFVIALAVFKYGANDLFALIVFAFFAFGAIVRSINLNKGRAALHNNPTPEQCVEIAENIYELNYAGYYEARQDASYESILLPKPRYFKVFQIFSIIMASVAALLGILCIIFSIIIILNEVTIYSESVSGMLFLYGSLCTYFGIKDFIEILRSFRTGSIN